MTAATATTTAAEAIAAASQIKRGRMNAPKDRMATNLKRKTTATIRKLL